MSLKPSHSGAALCAYDVTSWLLTQPERGYYETRSLTMALMNNLTLSSTNAPRNPWF